MIQSFAELDNRIKEANPGAPKVLAVAAAEEEHILQAVCEAARLGIIRGILVGDAQRISEIAEKHGFDLKGFELVNCGDIRAAAREAVELVQRGEAQILMKGLLDSSIYLKAILDKERGLRSSQLLSQVSLFEIEKINRLLIITDPAMNPEPGLEEKEIIMKNAVSFARVLGIDCPRVAFICPIEKVNPRMDSTLHAKALTEKYGGNKEFLVDGPFGFDIAVSAEAARIKGIGGPVAGNADILLVNDIGVGGVLYKSLVYLSNTRNGGVVVGAKAPVLMTSRSDSTDTKLNSIKLGVLLANYNEATSIDGGY